MGVTNFDNLPQNHAATRIAEARQVQRELKGSPQRSAGANLRYHRITHETEFLWSGRVDGPYQQSFSTGQARLVITLTSMNAEAFLARLAIEYYGSSDSGTTWSKIDIVGTPFNPPALQISPLTGVLVEPYTAKWQIFIRDSVNVYRAIKVQALSTDIGVLSIVRYI